jgi:ABC-type protease/lipase transport system fused ATPase/permease subunit
MHFVYIYQSLHVCRLATIADSDRILVVRDGSVAVFDTPANVMCQSMLNGESQYRPEQHYYQYYQQQRQWLQAASIVTSSV